MQTKVYKKDKIVSKTKEVKKKMSKKTRVLLIVVAAVLALSLLGGVLFSILTYSPTVLRYGGATLGEDAYSYWFACMKYQLMIQNRNLGIEDSYAFWDKTAENGKTYEELFKTAADREIALTLLPPRSSTRSAWGLAKGITRRSPPRLRIWRPIPTGRTSMT